MSFIIRWAFGVFAVWLTILLGRLAHVGLEWKSLSGAILFVLVLAIVNAVIRPIVKLFALPLSCMTLGLFTFVINALLFWVTANVTGGLDVKSFWAALFGSVVLSILSGIINSIFKHKPGQRGSQ